MSLSKEEIFDYFYREHLESYMVYQKSIDSKPKSAKVITTRLLQEMLHERKALSILDIGCGGCELTQELVHDLASARPELPIYLLASDASGKMLELAGSQLKGLPQNVKVEFRQVGVYPQPAPRLFEALGKKHFDFLLCSFVMFYIEDWQDALKQFLECLNPGGYLCVILRSRDTGKKCVEFFNTVYEIVHGEAGYGMEYAEDFEEFLRRLSITFDNDYVVCNTNLRINKGVSITEPIEFVMRYPKDELPEGKAKALKEYISSSVQSNVLKCYDKLIWVKKQ